MATVAAVDSAIRRIERTCRESTGGDELFERLSADLHDLVPHEGAVWFGADPVTQLITSPVRVETLHESTCDPFWHHEFHVPDTGLYVDLARSPSPAAGLRLSLDGRVLRSARYRDLMAPYGYDDELRSVLRVGENTWGLLGLYREKGREPFTEDEVALVGRASPIIASALRAYVRVHSPWLGSAQAPGLVVFDDRSRVLSANAEALDWLLALVPDDRLPAAQPPGVPVPRAVADLLTCDELERQMSPLWALLSRSRAIGRGLDDRAARLRLRDRRGRWLLLHGSCLSSHEGEPSDSVAIVIEPAKSSEIAPIIIEAYSLTPRERDVVGAIARGDSTSEIAGRLYLSPHTVRDHIKTVFAKVGVSSRAELVAKLFAEHYTTPAHADLLHVD